MFCVERTVHEVFVRVILSAFEKMVLKSLGFYPVYFVVRTSHQSIWIPARPVFGSRPRHACLRFSEASMKDISTTSIRSQHSEDSCFCVSAISYPESSGSLVSGLVARRDSGEMEFFPQKSGVPVVVRMLSFIKTEVNVSREVGVLDESLARSTII